MKKAGHYARIVVYILVCKMYMQPFDQFEMVANNYFSHEINTIYRSRDRGIFRNLQSGV